MSYRHVIAQFGLILLVLAACMLLVTAWSAFRWAEGDTDERLAVIALLVTFGFGAALGASCWLYGRRRPMEFFGRREALLIVAMGWLLGAALAAMPYRLWAMLEQPRMEAVPFATFADCYFESMSGLTTTGASILTNIEVLPKGLLLWRATTHWLGGLGIVVLFVAILPAIGGAGARKIFFSETPGPVKSGVRPRIAETARTLWIIYLVLTAALVGLLKAMGLSWFDAVCHGFSTVSTGGFANYNASIGHFHDLPAAWGIESTILLFSLLASVNFALYYQLSRRRFRDIWCDPELRLFLGIFLAATVLVGLSIYGDPIDRLKGEPVAGAVAAGRHAAFQVASIQTTGGFATADYNAWDFLAKAVLVTLMFVGGCAGSTSGGLKVVRILVAAKIVAAELQRVFRPTVVRTIRVGRSVVDADMRQAVLVYILGSLVLWGLASVALMLVEPEGVIDYTTAATASAATLYNVGPGLGAVGPASNFGWMSGPSKLLLSLLMALGRLEVYTILVLLLPGFWRRH